MYEDPRSQKTRDAIDRAFMTLLRKKDFESISVKDVTQQADINRSTFYRHYIDKYDWLEQCLQYRLEEIIVASNNFQHCKDLKQVEQTYLPICRHFDENFAFYKLMLNNKGTNFFQQRFKNILTSTMYRNMPSNHEDPLTFDFLVNYATSAVAGIIEWWIKNDRPISPDTMAVNLSKLYIKTLN